MNRKKLLALARKQGFTGEETLDALTKFFDEKGITLQTAEGDPLDMKAAWSNEGKKTVITVDEDPNDDQKDDADDAQAVSRRKELEAKQKADGRGAAGSVDTSLASPSRSREMWKAKAYNQKANSGKTVFADYDAAELFMANLRLGMHEKSGDPRFQSYPMLQRDREICRKASSTGSNVLGGALIPDVLAPQLISLKERYGAARGSVGTTPMSDGVLHYKRRTTGFTGYWVSENSSLTSEDVSFDNLTMTASKLTILSLHSSEMLTDTNGEIADVVADEIAVAFGYKEDQAYFNGDGTSTYGGYTGVFNKLYNLSGTKANIAGLVVGANSWSGLTLEQHQNVLGLLPDYADSPRCAWYCSRAYFFQVMDRLARAAGGVTDTMIRDVRIPPGIAASGRTFLGYPVVFVQVAPNATSTLQLNAVFGDLSMGSKFGEVTGSMAIDQSDQRYFDTDQIAIRAKERVAVNVHDVGNASATASARVAGPIVGIATGN